MNSTYIGFGQKSYDIKQQLIFLLITFIFLRDITLLVNQGFIASVLFIAIFLVLGILLYFSFIPILVKSMTIRNWLVFSIGLICLIVITTVAISNVGLNLITNAKSTVGILMIIAFLMSEQFLKIDKRIIRFYLNFNVVISLLLCVLALLPTSYNSHLLTFHFPNSNQAGLFVFLNFGFLFIYFIKVSKDLRIKRLLIFTILSLQFVLCILTQSRTSIIACLSIILIYYFSKRKITWVKQFTWLFLLIPIIVPIIMISLYNSLPNDYMILGKSFFSGREVLWNNIFTIVTQNPFIVNFNQSVPTIGMGYYGDGLGTHNAFLGILWNYSLPVMVLIYFLFIFKVHNCSKKVKGIVGISMIAVLLSMFFHMAFEETLLSGGVNYMLKAFFLVPMIGEIENER